MTNTTTPTDETAAVTATVDTYLASLHETDADRRAELVAAAWAPEGRFVDPLQDAKGHAALAEIAPAVHELYPGSRFRRLSGVDAHHGYIRFAWDLVASDGSVIVAGLDVGQIADDGKLLGIVGFFGELPES